MHPKKQTPALAASGVRECDLAWRRVNREHNGEPQLRQGEVSHESQP